MKFKQILIGDLGRVVTGNTPPKKDPSNYGGPYPFVKPTDMNIGERHTLYWDETYSEKAFKRYKRSYIRPGATGVVTIGTVGEKIFQTHEWCFTNQSVNVVVSSDEYDDDFVYYLLKVSLPKVLNANPGTASGRHHVSKSNFSSIKIRVPELLENQKKIARLLSRYDDLIENNLRRIGLLEELARETYREWFVRGRFPGWESARVDAETGLVEGWEIKKLSSVAKLNPRQAKKGEFDTIRYIDIRCVSPDRIELPDSISFSDAPGRARRKIKDGDILWSCVRPNRKSHAVVWNSEPNDLASTGFCVISPFKVPTSYLYQFVTTDDFVGYLVNLAGGAAYPAVKKEHFADADIIIPAKELLDLFDKQFGPSIKLKAKLEAQNTQLREARDLLLPRLMAGVVEVDKLEKV